MVYSPGTDPRSGQPSAENGRLRGLFAAIAILGLATYGVSFGPVINGSGATGWYVRFAALAALVAAFGLFPKGKPYPTVIAVFAALGFLDALSSIVTSNPYAEALGIGMLAERGWALTVIVVLNALQAAAAVAALLLGPKAQTETTTGYEAYVDYYNEAVRNYYSQQARSAPPEQAQRSAQGQAYADAQAAAQARRTQRPSQYGDYAELDYTTSRPGAPSQQAPGGTSSAGMPNVGHTQRSADRPQQEGDQSAWPGSPA